MVHKNIILLSSDIKIPNSKKFFSPYNWKIVLTHCRLRHTAAKKKATTKLQVSLSPQFKYYHSLMIDN